MKVATLGDIADWGSGGTPKRSVSEYFGDGFPWLSIADLNDGVIDEAKESLTDSGIKNSSAKLVPPGTILVAMYGSIGKLGVAGRDLCTSQAIAYAKPDPKLVDRSYLFYYLLSERSRLQSIGRGGTQMNIGQGDLKRWPIPLPSLEKQRQIAAILDQADTIRGKRRQVLDHLDTLAQSIFHDMFGKESWRAVTPAPRKSNEYGWHWVLLDEVGRLATGHTPNRNCEEYWNGSIPWISLPDIRALDGCEANDTSLHIAEAGVSNSSAVVLPPGTVCFSRTASVGFVTKMGRNMATSQDFHNWVPGPALNSEYLMAALRSSRSHLLSATDGSTHKTIYQRTAKQFRVLLPPRDVQDRFANWVEHINTQRALVQRALDADDELFASLQARAFRGEL